MQRFCAAALVAGSLSRTLRQGLAALNAQFMSAFTAATLYIVVSCRVLNMAK